MSTLRRLNSVHQKIKSCRACPQMCSTPVHGPALETAVMLIGQAPGVRESETGQPFAYTAGTTLFKWLKSALDLDEEELRNSIYIAAVARCFPGKSIKGAGDREPSPQEILNCRPYLQGEIEALQPKVILAVGRIAIGEVLGSKIFPKGTPLAEVVGRKFQVQFHGYPVTVIALPHPSGVSRWPQTEPGKTKLKQALALVRKTVKGLID